MIDHSSESYIRAALDAITAENYSDAIQHLNCALEALMRERHA